MRFRQHELVAFLSQQFELETHLQERQKDQEERICIDVQEQLQRENNSPDETYNVTVAELQWMRKKET